MPRYYLIRAIGPSLAQYGVPAAVADPSLQLFKGQAQIAANEDWDDGSNKVDGIKQAVQRTSAFALLPGSKDAALVVLLAPGIYSAMGRATQSGEILREVYLIP